MKLNRLELDFFRNYSHVEAAFHPRVNLIYGDNAQGRPICWRPSPTCPLPGPTGPGMTGSSSC